MTEQTNTATNEATATAEGVKGPRVVKHLTVRIEEARENVAAAQAKLDKLVEQQKNEALFDTIKAGDNFDFNFGRGDKARVLNGTVVIAEQGKGASNKVRFTSGTGFDAIICDVLAGAIVFPEGSASTGDLIGDALAADEA